MKQRLPSGYTLLYCVGLCAFLLVLCSVSVPGQNLIRLQDALTHAYGNSYAIQSAKLNLESSQRSLEAFEKSLMTSVNLEIDAPRYSRSLRSQFNTELGSEQFFQIGNTTVESRLNITQPLIFSNGTFTLTGSLFGRDQDGLSSAAKRDYFSNLSLHLSQPLFGFNSLSANKVRSEINLDRASRNFARAEADIRYSVTASFYELCKAKQELAIANEKIRQNEVLYQTSQNKFKAGLIAEVEALQLEVDLSSARNDALTAQTAFDETKNDLKIAAGYPLDTDIDVDATLEFEPVIIVLDSVVQMALDNRAEIKNTLADIELNKLSVAETSARGRITGLLSLNYGINKNDEKFSDVFRDFLDDRSVTFTLQVPVWDWGKNRSEVQSAEANLKMAELNANNQEVNIRKEIKAVYNKFEAAKARVEVLKKSVELAQKSYDISVSRFDAGTITSFDLSQMQLRLTTAKLSRLSAMIDYVLAVADMERKTLHRFTR